MDYELTAARAVELLCRLIEVPRVSREERQAADLLQAYMNDELGLQVQREANNLWSVSPDYDEGRPTLLLNAHIDTVRPVSGWQRNPFKATREGGRIYGLGSNDDGASLVSLLHVFAELTRHSSRGEAGRDGEAKISSPSGEAGRDGEAKISSPSGEVGRDGEAKNSSPSGEVGRGLFNLIFLASSEEEVSGRDGVERVLPLLPKIDVALVGEPTGMQPAVAEKGLMVLDCTARGKAGHAARDEGDNAIYHAIRDIEWFRTHRWERVSPLLGAVKMSVTVINAGTQHNVVPDCCSFTVDVRSNELYTNQELYDEIGKNVTSEVKARSFRLGSSSIDLCHPLVRKIIAQGGKPFGSPTLSDQALMPFPSLKMGPGDSRRSHSADEYIEVDEIRQAVETYATCLLGL